MRLRQRATVRVLKKVTMKTDEPLRCDAVYTGAAKAEGDSSSAQEGHYED
jgi:hypothetical protein